MSDPLVPGLLPQILPLDQNQNPIQIQIQQSTTTPKSTTKPKSISNQITKPKSTTNQKSKSDPKQKSKINPKQKSTPKQKPKRKLSSKSKRILSTNKVLGSRVYCQWPTNGDFYWGVITNVFDDHKSSIPQYTVSIS